MKWEDIPGAVWVVIFSAATAAVLKGWDWVAGKMQTNPGDVKTFLDSLMERVGALEAKLDLMQADNTRLSITNGEQLSTLISQVKEIASLSSQVTTLNSHVNEMSAEIKVLIALLSQTQVSKPEVAPALPPAETEPK